MAKNQTPTQKMMEWVLKNLNQEIEKNTILDQSLEAAFDLTLIYEEQKMKDFFIAGIMLGSGAYQLKKEFDTDEEFKKIYYKIFPEQ